MNMQMTLQNQTFSMHPHFNKVRIPLLERSSIYNHFLASEDNFTLLK